MKSLLFLVILVFMCMNAHTQAPPPPEDEDPDAPLDGGVTLLIAGGIGYGLKKACRMKEHLG
jgi:hypothetical protein